MIMLTNNVTKFDDDPLKNIQVTEQTRLSLANSKAITPKCFMGSGCYRNNGQDILPTNIFTKFKTYTMKTI